MKKESVKHRELKNMIRQNKHINNLHVSSFVSQEREGEQNSDADDEDAFKRETAQPGALALQ